AYPIGFGTDSKLYYHEKTSGANGAALSWSIETGYMDLQDGDTLADLVGMIPDFEDQIGNLSLTISAKLYPNGSETTHGPYTITPTTTQVDFRVCARQAKYKFSGSATATFARMGAPSFDIQPGGARR
ncbi:MAG TPA: hypothetical protein VHN20_07080, partial [Beijerinckiaceae bacterium]|nr:hypothetical protein [Beijerinckiaceae bacterium]